MLLTTRIAVFCAPVALLAACGTDMMEEDEEPGVIDSKLEEDETSPRDSLPGGTLERPCADRTVAQIQVRNGNRMSFCVLGDARTIYVEVSSEEKGSYLDEIGIRDPFAYCALDLYMEVTDESKPLPVELLDSCPEELRRRDDYDRREPIKGGYFEEIRETLAGSYCGSNGQNNALAECPACDPYDDCVVRCDGKAYGWHQHTLSVNLGEEGNLALDRNGSCGGNTRVRGWDRDDIGDSWGSPDIDFQLGSGKKSWTGFIYHSGLFGQDYDFKLRADSASGAFHRYGSYFEDE